MNEIWTTVCGNVVKDPIHRRTDDGLAIVKFRVATTPFSYSKSEGRVDGATSYVTVTCFRWLAENAGSCVAKGDPVVVFGKLSVNEYASKDGHVGHDTEIVASAIGHDLNRGTSAFRRGRAAAVVQAVAEVTEAPEEAFENEFEGSFDDLPLEPAALADLPEADAA